MTHSSVVARRSASRACAGSAGAGRTSCSAGSAARRGARPPRTRGPRASDRGHQVLRALAQSTPSCAIDRHRSRRLRSEHDRALRRQPAAAAVRDRDLGARRPARRPPRRAAAASPRTAGTGRASPGCVADSPPPSVFVGSAPPSRRLPPPSVTNGAALALRREAEVLEHDEHGVGERVVHREHVDVGRRDAGLGERLRPADRGRRCASCRPCAWIEWCVVPPAAPRTYTGRCARSRARSSVVRMMQQPPSEITQQSSLCSGSATSFEPSTSSTVIGSRYIAFGLRAACSRVCTEIDASCSGVVPYSCMCRCAAIAYAPTSVSPVGNS